MAVYRSGQQPDPPQQFAIPAIGKQFGGLNKYDVYSRWCIGEDDADEFSNFLPMGAQIRQVPNNGASIATLAASLIWMSAQILNGNVYNFCLCTDNNIYQVSTTGTITKINGAAVMGAACDIANWQGTTILFCDNSTSKIYSWTGSVFATVFSAQPTDFIGVFGGRLWMSHGSAITYTAGNGFNSLGGDAGSFLVTLNNCSNPILGFYDFGGVLYVFGSNWIAIIGNLYVTGSPAQLTFTFQALESQIGIINKWSIISLGSIMYFANSYGIWSINGTQPVKISPPLDGFFQNLDAASSFSGSFGVVYEQPCLFWNVKWTGDGNTTVFGVVNPQFNEFAQFQGQWFRLVSGTIKWISAIVSSAITNNVPQVWGCDGTNIFLLFSNTSTAISSQFNTKFLDFGSKVDSDVFANIAIPMIITGQCTISVKYLNQAGNQVGQVYTITFNSGFVQWVNNASQVVTWQNNALATVGWSPNQSFQFQLIQFEIPFSDRALGININVSGVGNVLQSVIIGWRKSTQGFGT